MYCSIISQFCLCQTVPISFHLKGVGGNNDTGYRNTKNWIRRSLLPKKISASRELCLVKVQSGSVIKLEIYIFGQNIVKYGQIQVWFEKCYQKYFFQSYTLFYYNNIVTFLFKNANIDKRVKACNPSSVLKYKTTNYFYSYYFLFKV